MLDLKVINGTLLMPGVGEMRAGVGCRDVKVAWVGTEDSLPGAAALGRALSCGGGLTSA